MALKEMLWSFKNNKKAQIAVLIVLVIAVSIGAGYMVFGGNKNANITTNTPSNSNSVTLVRRAIDGVMVPQDQANPFPVAVMIENLVGARPQSGLEDANVVYEALAEGGITRFMAVYAGGTQSMKIGPVRSARPYYLDWAKEYDAVYAHAGGSPDALTNIVKYAIRDLNQFTNSQYFWRDKERLKTYASEHTLFTSAELLQRSLRDKKIPETGAFESWKFADAPVLDARPTDEHSISINFSTFNYKVDYTYDRTTNTYLRKLGEQTHTMENGKTIAPTNVIVQYVSASLTGDEKGRLAMQTIGEGRAVVFHNGTTTEATWKKTDRDARTRFYDTSGTEVVLTAGSTWVEVVPPDHQVSYK